jgi:hypothetical protein
MLQIHMTAVEGLSWSTVMDWVFPVAPGKIPDDRISGHRFLYNDLPEISGWLLCTYPYQTHCWSWRNRWVVMTAHHCCSWWRWVMVWYFVSNSHKVMMLIVILSSKVLLWTFPHILIDMVEQWLISIDSGSLLKGIKDFWLQPSVCLFVVGLGLGSFHFWCIGLDILTRGGDDEGRHWYQYWIQQWTAINELMDIRQCQAPLGLPALFLTLAIIVLIWYGRASSPSESQQFCTHMLW